MKAMDKGSGNGWWRPQGNGSGVEKKWETKVDLADSVPASTGLDLNRCTASVFLSHVKT